ncbi:hypothetical protein C5167_003216 [Papaver somniferum]|uniref:Uncharacterized protein n=1 Tax=Papaver somniferum TaxID=3469 RepID=A0A4Y7L0A3_PAPSO|nr:hypothetical protein C5167_003216 [Papaver somniferum]
MEPPIPGLSLYAEDDDDDDPVMNEWQVIIAVIFVMIFVDVRASFGGSLMHRVLMNAYKEVLSLTRCCF